jgi:chromosome segregation ATPase
MEKRLIKVYILIFVLGILSIIGYGAKYYYDTTQNTIKTLQENNTKLEVAVETAEASTKALQADIAKSAALNKKLQQDLQKAESYGDELRSKLNKLNLIVEALTDAKVLEGKMNGATAKLWREFMGDTGNNNQPALPKWLQQSDTGTKGKSSNSSTENNNTNSSSPKSSTTN